MLGGCGDSLIQQVLEGLVVCKDGELLANEVGMPVVDGDENGKHFLIVHEECLILRRYGLAQEGYWVPMLRENSATDVLD